MCWGGGGLKEEGDPQEADGAPRAPGPRGPRGPRASVERRRLPPGLVTSAIYKGAG